MKAINLKFLLVCSLAIAFSTAPLAVADWYPGDPYKMHAPQEPDPFGWDVCICCQAVADDFKCAETGPITDIHFWTSWLHDDLGEVLDWHIAIYDDAKGQPGKELWRWDGQGNITIIPYGTGDQGWVCPVSQWQVPSDHKSFYQVNITEIIEPFKQEQDTVYWLVISAVVENSEASVGWKTSTNDPPGPLFGAPAQWSIDAINWQPVVTGATAMVLHDMAFVITGVVEPDLDFGDAPERPYPTTLAADGARHIIVAKVFLGALIDAEPDGQPDAAATGDDNNNLPDEDGVSFAGPLQPGQWATALVTPSVDGFINAWLDFNGDGDWDDPAEKILSNYPVTGASVNNCPFWVPFGAKPNISTFARFRFTSFISMPPISYTGLAADGEVEDYMVDIEDNPAIKWIQLPDTTPNGIDIKVDNMRWIADDFTCTRYGLITDVHLFGSWKHDVKGEIRKIHLSFHSDDPVGEGGSDPDNKFSKPDELLWEKDFFTGQFSDDALIRDLLDNGEYWWDPLEGELIPSGDSKIWRVDIYIPPHEAFLQEGSPEEPIIYWLDVQVETEFGEFGWKTRIYPEQHLDDAVFDFGSELPREWKELRYPAEHPYHPNSIDMAFILTGKDLKQPVPNLKWSQPPIEIDPLLEDAHYCGWNEESWTQNPDELIPLNSVVDDFRCIGSMPVTSVHFWGSYLGWDTIEPPLMQPIAWDVKFYANVAADSSCNFLYGAATGQPIGNAPSSLYRIDPSTGNALLIGAIGFNGVTGLSVGPDGKLYASANGDDLYADGFRHAILLTIDTSTGAGIFIGEISNNSLPNGAGRMPDISFSKDGVLYGYADAGPGGDALWTINTATGAGTFIGYTGFFGGGNGLDFAPDGTLYATPEDKSCLVTIDPTTGAGTCVPGTEPNVPYRINALDFCKQNGVLYGSWKDLAQNSILVKIDLQTGQPSVIGQTILGLDAITFGPEFSHPGNLLYQIQIPADRIQTEWAGYDEFPEMPFETCFQHHVDLNKEEYFWQDRYSDLTDDNIYWLGIRAIYPAGADIANPWGWKTRPASWMDDAVKYECRVVGWEIDPDTGKLIPIIECRYWPIKDPIWGESFDAAFELDTDPDYVKWDQPFTGIRHWRHYEDKLSMAIEDTAGNINIIQKVADDWLCKRRTPVTALGWWGSYLEYYYQPCQTMAAPPVPPDYFLITIHKDVPADDSDNPYGFSIPGKKLWQYTAKDYDEVLVGYDKYPEDQAAGPREPVYRYSVRLPEDNWFRQREVNGIYWISIMAVYSSNADINHKGWGWTIHKHVFADDAVAGTWDIGGPAPEWKWEEILDQTGVSADMSFTLFTDPYECVNCADYDWSGLVNFKDYAVYALNWLWTGPAGGYNNSDLNCDGKVDYEDLKIFTGQWLQSCPL